MHQPDGLARLLDAEHGDEAFGQAVAADDVVDQGFLAEEALLALVGPPGRLSQRFAVRRFLISLLRRPGKIARLRDFPSLVAADRPR